MTDMISEEGIAVLDGTLLFLKDRAETHKFLGLDKVIPEKFSLNKQYYNFSEPAFSNAYKAEAYSINFLMHHFTKEKSVIYTPDIVHHFQNNLDQAISKGFLTPELCVGYLKTKTKQTLELYQSLQVT